MGYKDEGEDVGYIKVKAEEEEDQDDGEGGDGKEDEMEANKTKAMRLCRWTKAKFAKS